MKATMYTSNVLNILQVLSSVAKQVPFGDTHIRRLILSECVSLQMLTLSACIGCSSLWFGLLHHGNTTTRCVKRFRWAYFANDIFDGASVSRPHEYRTTGTRKISIISTLSESKASYILMIPYWEVLIESSKWFSSRKVNV